MSNPSLEYASHVVNIMRVRPLTPPSPDDIILTRHFADLADIPNEDQDALLYRVKYIQGIDPDLDREVDEL